MAYARVEWNDSNDGERWYEGVCIVDPAVRRRGIGRALLAWTERRRLEIAAAHAAAGEATDRERALTTFVFDGDRGGATLLRGRRLCALPAVRLDGAPEPRRDPRRRLCPTDSRSGR